MKTQDEQNALKKKEKTAYEKLTGEELLQVADTGYPDYQDYWCLPDDTLLIVAGKFNTNPDFLITLNNLTNTKLSVGQHLVVPKVYQ